MWEGVPTQSLVRIGRYNASMSADEIAAALYTLVIAGPPTPNDLQFDPTYRGGFNLSALQVVACCHDRVSANLKAMGVTGTSFIIPNAMRNANSIGCASHTATHAPEETYKRCRVFYDHFWHFLVGAMARSGKAKKSFKDFVGRAWVTWSKTRFFGERDAIAQVELIMPLIQEWVLVSEADFDPTDASNWAKLRAAICPAAWAELPTDAEKAAAAEIFFYIKLEMALIVETSAFCRTLAYNAEGDSGGVPIVFYEELQKVKLDFETHVPTMSYPRITALIDGNIAGIVDEAERNAARANLVDYCQVRVQPCVDYFKEHFLNVGAPLKPMVQTYMSACLANPDYIRRVAHNGADLQEKLTTAIAQLRTMKSLMVDIEHPFIPHEAGLRAEFSEYIAASQHEDYSAVPYGEDVLNYNIFKEGLKKIVMFWKPQRAFPTWRKFAHLMMLHQPSSCAAERVFSILQRVLKRQGMSGAHIDLIEATVMGIFNNNDTDGNFQWLIEFLQQFEV